MAELLRRLNADGISRFQAYVTALKEGQSPTSVAGLLTDPAASVALDVDVLLDARVFADRFSFGQYLVDILAPLDRRKISRDHGLWTWLSLYFWEQLCPTGTPPEKINALEAYILPAKYNFYDYYRHLVRTPWLAVSEHGKFAMILLIPRSAGKGSAPLSVRGEIIEQLASRQTVFRNRRVIETAFRLYWDDDEGRPRRGAGGSNDANGVPRRLGLVLRQFDLTYDLDVVLPIDLIGLLPKEFSKWKR